MLKVEGTDITLTRGDTATLDVSITNSDGEDYEVGENDTLTLSVKEKITDTDYVFQKNLTGSQTFRIEPSDTKNTLFRNYIYDVQLTTANGEVYTVIEPSLFTIAREVTV